MSRKRAIRLSIVAGAILIASAAHAAQPSWPGSKGESRMMPMGVGMMMGPGMMGHGSMMGMVAPSGQMQQMMELCQQMM